MHLGKWNVLCTITLFRECTDKQSCNVPNKFVEANLHCLTWYVAFSLDLHTHSTYIHTCIIHAYTHIHACIHKCSIQVEWQHQTQRLCTLLDFIVGLLVLHFYILFSIPLTQVHKWHHITSWTHQLRTLFYMMCVLTFVYLLLLENK